MRAARSWALTASRVSFLACVRTRRPVVALVPVVRVVRADVVRRAAGLRLRAAGFFAAAGLGLVVELVVSDMNAPVLGFPLKTVFDSKFPRTHVRKPKSWTGYSGLC